MQPRNYLTQMLDELESTIPKLSSGDAVRAKAFIAMAKLAVCFNLPLEGKLIIGDPGLASIPLDATGFTRPPFQTIAIEYDLTCSDGSVENVVVVVAHDEARNCAVCIPSFNTPPAENTWRLPAFGFSLPYENMGKRQADGTWQYEVHFISTFPDAVDTLARHAGFTDINKYMEELHRSHTAFYLNAYLHLCAAIWTHEVTFTDLPPHKGRNKTRRAQGKLPLFTYKVLTIGKQKRKSAYQGGTHASPRTHARRGFYRVSKRGVRHWVQPCMVHGETPGFVDKDYKVEEVTQ